MSKRELVKLMDARLVLEPALVFEAARRTTPEFLGDVLASVEELGSASAAQDATAFSPHWTADERLHVLIAAQADNPFLEVPTGHSAGRCTGSACTPRWDRPGAPRAGGEGASRRLRKLCEAAPAANRQDGAVELREIETFLVLAEELHFGRTAERLYLSTSRVSQTVRAMELRVGARLFDRTSRQVRLTAVGVQLRDRLRPAFEEIEQAFAAARETAEGITGELRVSVLNFAAGGPAFEEIVRVFAQEHPGCRVTVYEAFPGEALNRLRRGELDIVVHWLPLDQPGLTVGPRVHQADSALAVPVGHPIAERGWATLEDLHEHAVADTAATLPPETARLLSPVTTPSGRPIPRRHQDGRLSEVLSLVARGEIVHPTVTSVATYHAHPGVTTVPLRDMPPHRSALVWATGRETSAVRAFATITAAVVGESA